MLWFLVVVVFVVVVIVVVIAVVAVGGGGCRCHEINVLGGSFAGPSHGHLMFFYSIPLILTNCKNMSSIASARISPCSSLN